MTAAAETAISQHTFFRRYIERSPGLLWARFYLKSQMNFKSNLMFNTSDYSKKQSQKKGFEKLQQLLHICPKQRSQQDLLQIQACLKTNRGFQCLPSKVQLQLCQVLVYQEYEAGTVLIKQGHVATECYLVLSGKIKVVMADEDSKYKNFTPETLCEAEGGDFIGETCLLTDSKRPASFICKSDAELLVIHKEEFKCILADLWHERFYATSHFLRKLPIFSMWPLEKIDLLVHCCLQRSYRLSVTHNLLFSGVYKCLIINYNPSDLTTFCNLENFVNIKYSGIMTNFCHWEQKLTIYLYVTLFYSANKILAVLSHKAIQWVQVWELGLLLVSPTRLVHIDYYTLAYIQPCSSKDLTALNLYSFSLFLFPTPYAIPGGLLGRCMVAAKIDRAQEWNCSDLLNQVPPNSFSREKINGQYVEGIFNAYIPED
ncbi:uncharacterized protein LOC143820027 [Paroedura picta]|uniref:uncharacterized protein LOC143820027 n=1 Tax=Paroedura picta TaxID=143630 RepID=UPI004056DEE3